MTTRPFPASLDAERALLGAALLDPEVLSLVDLDAQHFYTEGHGRLWVLLREAAREGHPLDVVGLTDLLLRTQRQADFGGIAYVSSLPDSLPVTQDPEQYARVVRDNATRRALVQTLYRSQEAAYSAESGAEAISQLRQQLDQIDQGPTGVDLLPVLEGVADRLDAEARGERSPRFRTGWRAFDDELSGIPGEGVTLVIAASSMGKTSLMNRLAASFALLRRARVHLHGSETSRAERARSLAMSLSGISEAEWDRQVSRARYTGDTTWIEAARARLTDWLSTLSASRLSLSGSEDSYTVDDLVALTERLHRRERLQVLIVDYLQDLAPTRTAGPLGDRTAQVSYASQQLKQVAGRLKLPVIVCAQRSDEKAGPGADPRPQMHDVQWAVQAAQDAAEVLALYREDYYRDRYGTTWKDRGGAPGEVEIIRRKCRTGPLKTFSAPFNGPLRWMGGELYDDRPDPLPGGAE